MVVIFMMLFLAACAGYQRHRENDVDPGQPGLESWIEKTLIPYLTQQLSRHPRFKDQPVLMVRMRGDNVLSRIDDLTEQIRVKITDALLKKNGLDLSWRPAYRPWQHYRRLEEISCGNDGKVRYYIGIETGLSKVNRKLHVKVKALNLDEQKWVSGFGRSWTGMPTRDQLEALGREHPDDHLLGMRPSPFSDRQPDMLAAYLARNLSCLLRRGESDELVVYVAPPAPGYPRAIKTAMKLVGRYLTRFREIDVTDDPDRANVTLVSAIHYIDIDKDLHQVWISARQKEGGIYLPGAETEAYVLLGSGHEKMTADLNHVKPTSSISPYEEMPDISQIITSLELLIPLNQKSCKHESPWESGMQRVAINGTLPTGSCLAVEMEVKKSAYVFLFSQDARGDLSRIYPSDCPAAGPDIGLLQPGELFRFPSSRSDLQAAVLEFEGSPGTERIYAIAITTPRLAAIFADRMIKLQDLCRSGNVYPDMLATDERQHPHERIQRWQNYLDWLTHNNSGLVEWRELVFQHKPSPGHLVEGGS
jgi:hypothetical protein